MTLLDPKAELNPRTLFVWAGLGLKAIEAAGLTSLNWLLELFKIFFFTGVIPKLANIALDFWGILFSLLYLLYYWFTKYYPYLVSKVPGKVNVFYFYIL